MGTGQEFDTFDACGFSVITNLVTPFWVLMVFAPNWKVTERVMESPWPVCLCALVHLALVGNGLQDPEAASRLEFFATQAVVKVWTIPPPQQAHPSADSSLSLPPHQFSAMQEMREAPSFVSEEWAHVLVWDLFAGRYIFLDGKEKKVPTFHSLLGAFALGPVGLLAHQATIPLWHKLVEGRETRGESREAHVLFEKC